jgi:hypothetical protein
MRNAVGVAQDLGTLIQSKKAELAVDGRERSIDEDEPGQQDGRGEEQRHCRGDDPFRATSPPSHS